jgi:hypothetical protein
LQMNRIQGLIRKEIGTLGLVTASA